MSSKLLAAVSATALLCTPVLASEPPAGERVVVTASRIGLEAHKVGSATQVFDMNDIRTGQIDFVKDVFLDAAGLFVNDTRPGGQTSVQIRGSENGQVLWLIDGFEVGDPSLIGSEFESAHLTSFDVSRIEILRGNQSSLYGSDAIGGVINIATTTKKSDGLMLGGEAEGGSFGWFSGGAMAASKGGPVDIRLSVTGARADGPSVADPNEGPASEDDPYYTIGFSGKLGIDLSSKTRLEFVGFGDISETSLDGTGQDATFFEEVYREAYLIGARLTHNNLDGRLRLKAQASQYTTDRNFRFTGGTSDFEGERQNLDLTGAFDVSNFVSVSAGFAGEIERSDTDGFGTVTNTGNHTIAGFGEVAVTPVEGATLTGAVRADDNSRFGTFVTYRFTAAYVAEPMRGADLKLRGSYGTGAKAPSLFQLFDPFSGNPDLEAEESRGFDVGFDLTVDALDALLSTTFFWTRVDNEIDFSFGTFTYIQRGETLNRGVEVSLQIAPADWLYVTQSYTYLQIDDLDDNLSIGKPRHIGSTSLTLLPVEGASATLRARYRSQNRTTEASFGATQNSVSFDLLGEYDVFDGVELYGRIVNLLDADYQYNYGFSTYDRSAFFGVRLSAG